MKKQIWQFCWLMFLCVLLVSEVKAQSFNPEKISWYNNFRIELVDKNSNNEIDLGELTKERFLFTYFKNQANFKQTDSNNNFKLSQRELNNVFKAEQQFLEQKWQKDFARIQQQYTQEQLSDAGFLKTNFGLLKQLVQNNIWLRKNTAIIKVIFDDAEWAEKHKMIIRSFSENIYYFINQGRNALEWYKNPKMKYGSESFMKLRSEHIRFLAQQQQLKKAKKSL